MTINYNIISIIDFLGLIQGVLFGLLLIFGNRKSRPSWLLGLFLITYSVEVIPAILTDTTILAQLPQFHFLPLTFHWLSVPLFYLYAKSLTTQFSLKQHWLFLLPGLIEFLIFTYLFFLPTLEKLDLLINEEGFHLFQKVFVYSSLIFSIFFAVKTILLVNHHQEKVSHYFSNLEQQQLKWVRAVAIFIIAFYSIWFVPLFISDALYEQYLYPTFGAINVIFIYWVGLSGLRQPKIEMLPEENIEATNESEQVAPPKKEDEQKQMYLQLKRLMEEEALFEEPDLTLPILAEKMKMTRRNLSQLINQKTGVNFNRFVNQYRVAAAKEILADPKFDHLNLLGVAFEVGFSSKATFFSVFKKFEGISPGAYKKKITT